MVFQGKSIKVTIDHDKVAHFIFSAAGSVNKFDADTVNEFKQVTEFLRQASEIGDVVAVLVSSDKPAFIVGADITEFLPLFMQPEEDIVSWIKSTTDVFDAFEDLPVPTAAAINGFALGGGCEMILTCDYRIADDTAVIGVPEVKLGIMCGFGGTVRLPRLLGADTAMEWMTTGKNYKAADCLKYGLVDAVVNSEQLIDATKAVLLDAVQGKLNYQQKRAAKLAPLELNQNEAMMCFSTAQAMVAAKAGKHYPAPHAVVETVMKAAGMARADAMALENSTFAKLAKTQEATAQVGIFLADQAVKAKSKKLAKLAQKQVSQQAVLGAGIMGGGIAYQGAVKGIISVMKDIRQDALELGLNEASSILLKGVERGKLQPKQVAATLNKIIPTLDYSAIKHADLVVEAVVENPAIKAAVLKETESVVAEDAIIASNTSTISIDQLAESLQKPERFCGMHFFNPVHKMPLVEVIRGKHTSEETIATVVATALHMGKVPIVVNDCPGFFVNRVLFPYLAGFSRLVLDGGDITQIDRVMEKEFGWPMGPAYLLDVIGLDTCEHAAQVMADGIPERMARIDNDPVSLLYKQDRLGQKNGKGFYDHGRDKKGRPVKTLSADAIALITPVANETRDWSNDEIIARLMVPMVNEVIRCLEEGIVGSAEEADIALLNGLGFPPFRGGVVRYLQTLGLNRFIEIADGLSELGPMYQVTSGMRQKAADNSSYFG